MANQPHPVEQLFARRLKTARAASGLTMRDLHAKSGASINTTSRAERGLGIAFGSAARIAEGLGFTLSEFLSSETCDTCVNRPAAHMVCADCGVRGGGQQTSRPRRVRNASAGVAFCAACHGGDCRNPPAPHTWVDGRDDPGLPDPVPPKLAAQLAADHPCACECARGES